MTHVNTPESVESENMSLSFAAQELGVTRQGLRYILNELGIKPYCLKHYGKSKSGGVQYLTQEQLEVLKEKYVPSFRGKRQPSIEPEKKV